VAALARIAVAAPQGAAADQVRREQHARHEAQDPARREADDRARREAETQAPPRALAQAAQLGALGPGLLGGGQGAGGGELGLVVGAESVAFAGGVVADAAGLVAGVGFGLARAARTSAASFTARARSSATSVTWPRSTAISASRSASSSPRRERRPAWREAVVMSSEINKLPLGAPGSRSRRRG
jgi:hypothetical protein